MTASPAIADRRRPTEAETADVLHRWHACGQDTSLIAALTGLPQAEVCRILAADQDRRHAARVAGNATSHTAG